MARKYTSVDDYLGSLEPELATRAERLRRVIIGAVPEATLAIRYNIPALLLDGRAFLYFGVWKKHIGLYPIYPGEPELEALVAEYRHHKDTLQFRHDRPLPEALVAELALRKLAEAKS